MAKYPKCPECGVRENPHSHECEGEEDVEEDGE